MVEFALTVGLVMLLIVLTAELAIFEHYESSLRFATEQGAFDGSLTGHSATNATNTTRQLWATLEPGAGPVQVSTATQGDLITVTASSSVPTLVPIPIPPFTRLPVSARSTHTIERFEPGSAP